MAEHPWEIVYQLDTVNRPLKSVGMPPFPGMVGMASHSLPFTDTPHGIDLLMRSSGL